MNDTLKILILFAVAGTLIACDPLSERRPAPGTALTSQGIVVIVDPATGCEYLSRGASGGITPRFAADGQIICKVPK
jgi:hypothetical protein